MSEYLEDLVAHIDTPVLNQLNMTFFPESVFDVQHLKQFIDRAKGLKPSKAAEMRFSSSSIHLDLQQPHSSSWDWESSGARVREYELVSRFLHWPCYAARFRICSLLSNDLTSKRPFGQGRAPGRHRIP
jgi:hypothetical protein